jgi:hypothetical protein
MKTLKIDTDEVLSYLEECDEAVYTLPESLNRALVGYTEGDQTCAVYDYDTLIEALCERDEMDVEDAEQYFEYNIAGTKMDGNAPVYVRLPRC